MSSNKSHKKRPAKKDVSDVIREANNDDNVFTVEEILDKKLFGTEWKYLVKWDGWPKSQSTWEPADNLDNIKESLEEFEKEWANKHEGKDVEETQQKSAKNTSQTTPKRKEKSSNEPKTTTSKKAKDLAKCSNKEVSQVTIETEKKDEEEQK